MITSDRCFEAAAAAAASAATAAAAAAADAQHSSGHREAIHGGYRSTESRNIACQLYCYLIIANVAKVYSYHSCYEEKTSY